MVLFLTSFFQMLHLGLKQTKLNGKRYSNCDNYYVGLEFPNIARKTTKEVIKA